MRASGQDSRFLGLHSLHESLPVLSQGIGCNCAVDCQARFVAGTDQIILKTPWPFPR